MSKGLSTFKKTDVHRLISAATKAGLKIARIDVDPSGKISIVPADGKPAVESDAEFDRWKLAHPVEGS
jgi:hypothetical protein